MLFEAYNQFVPYMVMIESVLPEVSLNVTGLNADVVPGATMPKSIAVVLALMKQLLGAALMENVLFTEFAVCGAFDPSLTVILTA